MANSSDRVKGGARLGPPGSFKEVVVLKPVRFVILAFAVVLAASQTLTGSAGAIPTKVRVTHANGGGDTSGAPVSRGTYTDPGIQRRGNTPRPQKQPALAIQ